ncbi:hypothetical protein [Metallosphaera hakonensis]|uniref:Clan AA aspartic protease n=1 Tax=Metallosphaera hakonensis JCM 8857 = DSM 7519 TaxID=1293036 RepID=A0A2U9IR60_9CREN|nr:hypothetical protein [Metallosphaera hakonensis]AWR98457.1 clan AA aspartic protease [Metallosphaera hakonensis JCM 8857 = DSM 7519]
MNLDLEIGGLAVTFKLDTGFDGECLLDFNTFSKIAGEEIRGPYVKSISGEYFPTRLKLVEIRYGSKSIKMACLTHPNFSRNLIGENGLQRIGLTVNYKENKVEDP